MKVKKWLELNRKHILKGHVFNYVTREIKSPSSAKQGVFDLLECCDWVNVIALHKNQLVLVKQYRSGIDDITLELPGGGISRGEMPQKAAFRELREETGYSCDQLKSLGSVDVNPAFMNNRCHFFLAEDVTKAGEPQFDLLEEIELVLVDKSRILELLNSGQISHSLSCLALRTYLQQL